MPGLTNTNIRHPFIFEFVLYNNFLSDFTFTFHFHALEKEMATHSSVLAWRIPGMGEPGVLPSMGSHRVGHDWSNLAAAPATSLGASPIAQCRESACQCRRHRSHGWMASQTRLTWVCGVMGSTPGLGRSPGGGHGKPLQYSCLENPRDGGARWAAVYGVAQSRTRLKRLSSSRHS